MPKMIEQPIKLSNFIKVDRDKVFETITTPSGWDGFFTSGMEIDLKPGGEMKFVWKDFGPNFANESAKARILRFSKPEQFVFQWYPVTKDNPTTIEINLVDKYGGTVVELIEYGYPDSPEGIKMLIDCSCGWGEALTLLKFYLEFNIKYQQPER